MTSTHAVPPERVPRLLGSYGDHRPGPLVVGIGGMHGNEPAGVIALQRVLHRLESAGPPFRGRLVGLAGNRAALTRGCRYIDEDFNRVWLPGRLSALDRAPQPADMTSEQAEQRDLLAAFEALIARRRGPAVCLDLHTTSADGTPFVVIGDTLPNRRFAFNVRVPVILGLEEQLDGTLLSYLSGRGYVAIGFEGGQHAADAAVENHMNALWSVLGTAGCLRTREVCELSGRAVTALPDTGAWPPPAPVFEVQHHHVIQAGDRFIMQPGFTNFQPVTRGQLLACDRHGPIRARASGRILMPLYQGQGSDGFFLVRRVRPAWLRVAAWLRRQRMDRLLPLLPGVRRHPEQADTLVVDARVARWFVLEIFHLLGFRQKRRTATELIVSRRWNEPYVFNESQDQQG